MVTLTNSDFPLNLTLEEVIELFQYSDLKKMHEVLQINIDREHYELCEKIQKVIEIKSAPGYVLPISPISIDPLTLEIRN